MEKFAFTWNQISMQICVPGIKTFLSTIKRTQIPNSKLSSFNLCCVWVLWDKRSWRKRDLYPWTELLIPNCFHAHYLFSDSLAYQSTVEIKAAFTFLSLISSFLIAILTKKKQLFTFQNLWSTSQINPFKQCFFSSGNK